MNAPRPPWMTPDRLARIQKLVARNLSLEANLEGLSGLANTAALKIGPSDWERFFTRASDMPRRADLAMRTTPDAMKECLRTADRVLAHELTLLGSGWKSVGFPISWHTDIRSGYRWDPEPDYRTLPDGLNRVLNTGGGVELKAPWDLSNLHWLMTLTAARHVRRDPAILRVLEQDVRDWIAANPPFRGVNWYCAMNVAMRAVSLLTALAALYPDLEESFVRDTLRSLYVHGVRILSRLEFGNGKTRNNHYLSDLIGLYFLGVLFEADPAGAEWMAFAREELETEARLQFYPDGVVMEDSTSYHRFSTEILLLCAMLGESAGHPFSSTLTEGIRRSLGFTRDILRPDGTIPQFGDNDNGRMLPLFGYMTRSGTDHRHILALGGEFFGVDAWRRIGAIAALDPIWLLGRFEFPETDPKSLPSVSLRAYPDSGFRIIRDPLAHIVIRNGRILADYGGGHAHSDALSFTLTAGGQDLFVDAGTHNYSADIVSRNDFRSTAYHNTIQVEDEEAQEFERDTLDRLWGMQDRAAASTLFFGEESGDLVFRGRIESYAERFGIGILRELRWNPAARRLTVKDSALPVAKTVPPAVQAVSRFLLAPHLAARTPNADRIEIGDGKRRLAVLTAGPNVRFSTRPLWYSPEYGARVPTLQIEAAWATDGTAILDLELEAGI